MTFPLVIGAVTMCTCVSVLTRTVVTAGSVVVTQPMASVYTSSPMSNAMEWTLFYALILFREHEVPL